MTEFTSPTTNLLPPLPEHDFEELKDSIRKYGYLPGYPVTLDQNGDIIDGHHRSRACEELRAEGVEVYPDTITVEVADDWERALRAIEPNIIRRVLNAADKAFVVHKLRVIHDRVFKPAAEERAQEGRQRGADATKARATSDAQALAERSHAADHATPDQEAARAAAADWSEVGKSGGPGFNPEGNAATYEQHRKRAAHRASDDVGAAIGNSGRHAERLMKRVDAFVDAAEAAGRQDLISAFDTGRMKIDAAERALNLVSRGGRTLTTEDAALAVKRELVVEWVNKTRQLATLFTPELAHTMRELAPDLFVDIRKIERLYCEAKEK